MTTQEPGVDTEDLFEQTASLDEAALDAVTVLLVEDPLSFYEGRDEPASHLLQQVYDTVANETRIVRGDSGTEFAIGATFERDEPLVLAAARDSSRGVFRGRPA